MKKIILPFLAILTMCLLSSFTVSASEIQENDILVSFDAESVEYAYSGIVFDIPGDWNVKTGDDFTFFYPKLTDGTHAENACIALSSSSTSYNRYKLVPSLTMDDFCDDLKENERMYEISDVNDWDLSDDANGFYCFAKSIINSKTYSSLNGIVFCNDWSVQFNCLYNENEEDVYKQAFIDVISTMHPSPGNEPAEEIIEKHSASEKAPSDDTVVGTFEADLGAGYYTAGVDIPKGSYNLTAISGSGNVMSRDADINEIMAYPADEYYIDTFNGANFKYGGTLFVGGDLVLHIKSDDAEINNMTPRQISGEVATDLSAGNYTAGTNFPVGTYNIIGIQGSGNVISGEADVNEIISDTPKDGYVTQINNVKFSDGDSLELSGCSVRLEPIGE